MMWGSDYPHSESTFPQSRKILAKILEGVPDVEQAKIASGNTARLYQTCLRIDELRPHGCHAPFRTDLEASGP